MSDPKPAPTVSDPPANALQPVTVKQGGMEAPILMEIKAAVEKLQGQVTDLTERMGKQEAAKPNEKYPYPEKKQEEEKKPKEKEEEKGDLASTEETEKLPTADQTSTAQKAGEEKKPKDEEEEKKAAEKPKDEEEEKKAAGEKKPDEDEEKKEKKPGEYPYPEKKQSDTIFAELNALKEQVDNVTKIMGLPVKRTTVIRKADLNKPMDFSTLSWDRCHELARPFDLSAKRWLP